MASQFLHNRLYYVLQHAGQHSDPIVVFHLIATVYTLFIPNASLKQPISSTTILFLVSLLVTIHLSALIISATPRMPILNVICRTLACISELQIAWLLVGPCFEKQKTNDKENLELGVSDDSGELGWMTPLRKKQSARIEGVMVTLPTIMNTDQSNESKLSSILKSDRIFTQYNTKYEKT